MTTGRENVLGKGKKLKKLLALSAAALMALTLSNPASAAVRADKSITIFHNIDMVGAAGYVEGEEMTVEVVRNGIEIGSATGPAVETPDGAGLEINHGPAGDPQPGDCWDGSTPDIIPGDEIRVTGDGGTDTVIVPNVDFTTEDAVLVTAANQGQYPDAQPGDVVVEGVAFDQAGDPIPAGALAGEVRNVAAPRYRSTPNEVVDLGGGAWQAIYRYGAFIDVQNRDGITSQDVKQQKILTGEHTMTFAPLLQETYISDMGADTGPGPGCEGVAPSAAHAVTTFDDRAVNIGSGSLVASGTTTSDAESVSVDLSDGTNTITQNATVNGRAWTATFDRASLETLADGTLTASGVYNVADPNNPGGTVPLGGATKQIHKDTVAPAEVTASLEPKAYRDTQSVSLNGPDDAAQIRYTIGADPVDPTATTGNVFSGPIQVTSSQAIKAIAVDAAGNTSGVVTFAYEIDRDRPNIKSDLESGTYDGPRSMTLSSDATDLEEIRYTTNGDEPDASTGEIYNEGQPIQIDATRTVKAVAIDRAGNVSGTLVRNLAIKGTTETALDMSTKKLVLGRSRTIHGSVAPDHAGGSVEVTIDRPGSAPSIVRPLTLDAASRYGFSYKPKATGTYRVTVSFVADDDSLESTSETRSFRVVRR